MQIQKGGGVSPHAKEKGVPKIYLAGKTGQEIPACSQNGEDAGQYQNAKQVRILGNNGQKEQNDKEKENNNPAWQDKDFSFEQDIDLSKINTQDSHSTSLPRRQRQTVLLVESKAPGS